MVGATPGAVVGSRVSGGGTGINQTGFGTGAIFTGGATFTGGAIDGEMGAEIGGINGAIKLTRALAICLWPIEFI